MSQRLKGRVKWFNNQKGYGFITPADKKMGDIFVHQSSVQMEGFRTLAEGEEVEFDTQESEKGTRAINVTKVGVTA